MKMVLSSGHKATFTVIILCLALAACRHNPAPDDGLPETAETPTASPTDSVKVCLKKLKRSLLIPAELSAFRDVSIYPKVQGFIKNIYVDRGSTVKSGQLLAEITAPELEANYREAQAKYEASRSALLETASKIETMTAQKEESLAKLQAADANYKRIQHAANTPGAIAPVDIEAAEKNMQACAAHLRAAEQTVIGAKSELESQKGRVAAAEQVLISHRELRNYLKVKAPFDGIIRERNVHEGSLVSSSQANPPMLRIQETKTLRLLVPVPESAVAGIKQGSSMTFTVPALAGKTFAGSVSRLSHGLDQKTRTMTVELDVDNRQGQLEPGMYAEVHWEMERPYQTTFVPSSAVLSSNDKTYVIRVRNSRTEILPVSRGQPMGNLTEIFGKIQEGDEIVLHAGDEIKGNSVIQTRLRDVDELKDHSGEKAED